MCCAVLRDCARCRRLTHAAQATPVDHEQLLDLMAEVQELGAPPADIVTSLAPDVELDDQGRPKMDPASCSIQ